MSTELPTTSVFELVDITEEETYYTLGVFKTLAHAISTVVEVGNDPTGLVNRSCSLCFPPPLAFVLFIQIILGVTLFNGLFPSRCDHWKEIGGKDDRSRP